MRSIFSLLSPGLRNKLAQYALLTHRKAVLAALPAPAPTKRGHASWASQPPAQLLQAVVRAAGQPGRPKVEQVVLQAWFQQKAGLRAVVSQSLAAAGYPLPALSPAGEAGPSPWYLRLALDDIRHQDRQSYYYPAGQRVAGADEASAEEITLMAHLLGWSVTTPVTAQTPHAVEAEPQYVVATAYEMVELFKETLHILAGRVPADLLAAVQRGELPDEVAPYWIHENWAKSRKYLSDVRGFMQQHLREPVADPDSLLTLAGYKDLLARLEIMARRFYIRAQHRRAALAVLARVEGLRHRQQPAFAPLAALAEHTSAVRAAYETEWPENEAVQPADPLPQARADELLAQAQVYELLLRLVDHPDELETLDETSEDFQKLEAATPSGVLNALLLGKLTAAA